MLWHRSSIWPLFCVRFTAYAHISTELDVGLTPSLHTRLVCHAPPGNKKSRGRQRCRGRDCWWARYVGGSSLGTCFHLCSFLSLFECVWCLSVRVGPHVVIHGFQMRLWPDWLRRSVVCSEQTDDNEGWEEKQKRLVLVAQTRADEKAQEVVCEHRHQCM